MITDVPTDSYYITKTQQNQNDLPTGVHYHLLPGRVRPLITAQILRYASMGKLINHDPQSPGRTKFSTFRMHDGRSMHCSPFKKEKKRQQLFLS